jgi:hypothetical protein
VQKAITDRPGTGSVGNLYKDGKLVQTLEGMSDEARAVYTPQSTPCLDDNGIPVVAAKVDPSRNIFSVPDYVMEDYDNDKWDKDFPYTTSYFDVYHSDGADGLQDIIRDPDGGIRFEHVKVKAFRSRVTRK